MNRLEQFLSANALHPIQAMNVLANANLISDNAVLPADVAEADHAAAIAFLQATLKPTPTPTCTSKG